MSKLFSPDGFDISAAQYRAENYLINGEFIMWQNGTSHTSPVTNKIVADRWLSLEVGSHTFNITRDTDVPTDITMPRRVQHSLLYTATNAFAPGAGDYMGISQCLEGLWSAPLMNRTATLVFWVKSNRVQTFCVALRNFSGTRRSFVQTFVINTINTWEKKTISVPLIDPAVGTWVLDNTANILVEFYMAVGSTNRTGTLGSWQTANVFGATAATNSINNGDTVRFANITLMAGSTDTGAQAVVPISDIEQRCYRYLQKTFPLATAPAQNAGETGALAYWASAAGVSTKGVQWRYPVRMRGVPALTLYNPGAANTNWRNITGAADSAAGATANINEDQALLTNIQVVGDAASNRIALHVVANAELNSAVL